MFLSTVDLYSGATVTSMTPGNTHEIEITDDSIITQAVDTVEIVSSESGLSPSRSIYSFNRAVLPVDWSFTTYLRPTSAMDDVISSYSSIDGNVAPVADWFLWQTLVSNTSYATGSVWRAGGKLPTNNVSSISRSHSSRTDFASAQETHLYAKLDNIIYQVSNATINQASVNGNIDKIASTTWVGYGTKLNELIGDARNNAVSVFGGILNNGSIVTANSNSSSLTEAASYHPYSSIVVGGNDTTPSYIKNRLSEIILTYAEADSSAVEYNFPVTAINLTYTNNINYLTPDELSVLNIPIGQFVNSRIITGSLTAYLRTAASAQFMRNVVNDARTRTASSASANIRIGGNTAPFVAFVFPAVQFNHPTLDHGEIISTNIEFIGQTSDTAGELIIIAKKQNPISSLLTAQDLQSLETQTNDEIYT